MIGTALSRHLLNQGYDVIILSRNPVETASVYKTSSSQNSFRPSGNIFYARWDTEKGINFVFKNLVTLFNQDSG